MDNNTVVTLDGYITTEYVTTLAGGEIDVDIFIVSYAELKKKGFGCATQNETLKNAFSYVMDPAHSNDPVAYDMLKSRMLTGYDFQRTDGYDIAFRVEGDFIRS